MHSAKRFCDISILPVEPWGYLLVSDSLRDVDTVQELTDILVLDHARLVDAGGGNGDVFNVGSVEDDLVLDSGAADLDASGHFDASGLLLTEVVADLDVLALVTESSVDREMGICAAHLVLESLRHTNGKVLDVRAHRADAGGLLLVPEPHRHNKLRVLVLRVHLQIGDVLERLGQRALRSLHARNSRLHLNGDALRHVDALLGIYLTNHDARLL